MFSSRPMQSLSKMRTIQFTTIQFGPVRSHVSGYFLQRKFFPSFFEGIRFRTWGIRIVFTSFFFARKDVCGGARLAEGFKTNIFSSREGLQKGPLLPFFD